MSHFLKNDKNKARAIYNTVSRAQTLYVAKIGLIQCIPYGSLNSPKGNSYFKVKGKQLVQ